MVSCQSRCSANLAFAVLLMVGSTLISLSFFVFPYWVFRSVTRVCRAGVTERKTFTRPAGRSDGYDPCRRQTVQKKNERRRRIGAPLRFPAPPRMGMAGHGPLSESSRSEAEGPLSPAPWGRAGWDPAALGPAGFAKGRCPLASAHSRMSNTGFLYFVKLRWTCSALNLDTVGVQLEHRRRLVPCFVVCLVYFMRECLFR